MKSVRRVVRAIGEWVGVVETEESEQAPAPEPQPGGKDLVLRGVHSAIARVRARHARYDQEAAQGKARDVVQGPDGLGEKHGQVMSVLYHWEDEYAESLPADAPPYVRAYLPISWPTVRDIRHTLGWDGTKLHKVLEKLEYEGLIYCGGWGTIRLQDTKIGIMPPKPGTRAKIESYRKKYLGKQLGDTGGAGK